MKHHELKVKDSNNLIFNEKQVAVFGCRNPEEIALAESGDEYNVESLSRQSPKTVDGSSSKDWRGGTDASFLAALLQLRAELVENDEVDAQMTPQPVNHETCEAHYALRTYLTG
ncbi:hypothetical protein C5167_028927 [Papaver somniferum]|nr:hypothetical protein C5167_028927 [Papaver somniferum]